MEQQIKYTMLLTVIFLFILIVTGCGNNKYYAMPEEVIIANIDFMNAENIEELLSTIHPDSPSYETTETLALQLFAVYNLNYKIEKLSVISENNEESIVEFTQLTTKINGPDFKNNRIKGKHILKKDGDSWKIYSTKVLETEFL